MADTKLCIPRTPIMIISDVSKVIGNNKIEFIKTEKLETSKSELLEFKKKVESNIDSHRRAIKTELIKLKEIDQFLVLFNKEE